MRLKQLPPEAIAFLKSNKAADPAALMLQAARYPNLPLAELVQQLQARQKAKHKLPAWAENYDLLFPANLSVEQASSEQTAAFKANLVSGEVLIDLTGGFGADGYAFAGSFKKVIHVEQQEELSHIVAYNFGALGITNVEFFAGQAVDFINGFTGTAAYFYLDPARRSNTNQKLHLLEDCEPDILKLLPKLLEKSQGVLLKTSPMLDIDRAVQQLKTAAKIWVIAVENECKEVLYKIGKTINPDPEIVAVNLQANKEVSEFCFFKAAEETTEVNYSAPLQFMYEPNAAIMKSGGFRQIAALFKLSKLHPNSHLYTSEKLVANFPGRTFQLKTVAKYQKKALNQLIPEGKANITVRNFPESVAEIRKKTGLKEGGNLYVFATTDLHRNPVILICEKI